jgi:magnesium transporter
MIKALLYNDKKIIKGDSIEFVKENFNTGNQLWVDIDNPDCEEIKLLSDVFKFHHLAIEDCIHRKQRPKIENYGDNYFIIIKAFKCRKKQFHYSELFLFLGKDYLVSLHWENVKVIDDLYLRASDSVHIFSKGIDFILYNLFDEVIDDYFPLTDSIGDEIDNLEERIIKAPSQKSQEEILMLKRDMLKLRKVLSPQREVINILLRHDFDLIQEENRLYFMDVYDHVLRIIDLLDTYQDLITGSMDLLMTQISNKTNEIMKVLTIITTIIMPLTLVTGIYGMNFKYIPELDFRYGYFGVLIVMAILVIIEFVYFKRKKWL